VACGRFAAEHPTIMRYRSVTGVALGSKCGQCHVDSRGKMVNTVFCQLRHCTIELLVKVKGV